ncbi:MAG: hypothetical protein FD149_1102 [Rhodospirillaceae bacterium]|nr:MAG: hypothetical protein FD149_1102 [Rhodospirillaceae bacterium]
MESDGAIAESVIFLEYFRDLRDPRQQVKVLYPLKEVLLLCLLSVLAGARGHGPLWKEEAGVAAAVSAVRGWDTVARSAWRHFRDAGCGEVPAVLCRLGCRGHRLV